MASRFKGSNQLARELHQLINTPPEDIQLIENFNTLDEIHAWIKGPERTPFEGGYFKVKLMLDDGFPQKPPKGYFVTKIFHPNVSAAGEICVNTLKKDWKPNLGIGHVLLTIKCLLIAPNPESALNEEAGRLLLEQYDDYANKVRFYTNLHATLGIKEYTALYEERSAANVSIDSALLKENTTTITTTTAIITPTIASAKIDTTRTNSSNTNIIENLNDTTILKSLSNNSPTTSSATVDSGNCDNKKRKHSDQNTGKEELQQQENSSGSNMSKDVKNDNTEPNKRKTKIEKRKKSLKRL